jgi:hypothetical protein
VVKQEEKAEDKAVCPSDIRQICQLPAAGSYYRLIISNRQAPTTSIFFTPLTIFGACYPAVFCPSSYMTARNRTGFNLIDIVVFQFARGPLPGMVQTSHLAPADWRVVEGVGRRGSPPLGVRWLGQAFTLDNHTLGSGLMSGQMGEYVQSTSPWKGQR